MQDKKNLLILVLVVLFGGTLIWGFTQRAQKITKEYAMEPEVEMTLLENGSPAIKTIALGRALQELAQICATVPQKTIDLAAKTQRTQ